MMTMKQVVLMTPMVLQLTNMVPLLMILMVPPRLPLPMRMLDVAVPAEDLAALLPDLTEEKLPVVDVPGASERPTGAHLLSGRHQGPDVTRGPHPGGNKSRDADVDSSPSQSHT